MAIDYRIPLSAGNMVPNLMPALQAGYNMGSQLRATRDANRLRRTMADIWGETGGDLGAMAQKLGETHPQAALGLQETAMQRRKSALGMQNMQEQMTQRKTRNEREQAQYDIGIIGKVAPMFLNLPDDPRMSPGGDPTKTKAQQWPQFVNYLERSGVNVPSEWKQGYTPDKAQQLQIAMNLNEKLNTSNQFAERKLQKYVDEQGFVRTFDPSTGVSNFALDPQGKKVRGQETYRYIETPEGYVPLSTKRPPTKTPRAVTGVIPAGKAKRDLETARIGLSIKKIDQEIDKAAKLAESGGQFKATQYAASTYGHRMRQANEAMNNLVSKGFDRTKVKYGALNRAPNLIKDPMLQAQAQAERNFVNAVLRRESGAAIAPSEFESAEKQYFPRSGDNKEVLKLKKQNRETVIAGMRAEAGGAWSEVLEQIQGKRKRTQKRRKATLEDF